jgi:glutamate dehydrogenase
MDYVGVRRYGADGKPSGEVRFVGLFTAEAYETPAREVPLIRRKVEHVLKERRQGSGSHNGKRLRNILETWPRDELFQISEDELLSMAMGVLHLYDRPRVRLFARRDPFDRFISVLMFVPRDRYDSRRARAGRQDPGRGVPAAGSRPITPASPMRRWRGCTTSSASRLASTASPT